MNEGIFEIVEIIAYIFLITVYMLIVLKLFVIYSKHKDKKLFYFGLTLLFISPPILSQIINSISLFLYKIPIPIELYLFIGYGFIFYGIANITWLLVFVEIVNLKKRKLFLFLIIAYESIFEVIFLIFLAFNTNLLGYYKENGVFKSGIVLLIHGIINLIITLISIIKLYSEGRETKDSELRLKGILLIIGIILYIFGVFIFTFIDSSFLTVYIFIIAGTFFYSGLLLPNWMKKIIIKQ